MLPVLGSHGNEYNQYMFVNPSFTIISLFVSMRKTFLTFLFGREINEIFFPEKEITQTSFVTV